MYKVTTLAKQYDNSVLQSERFDTEDEAVGYLMSCRYHHPEMYHYVHRTRLHPES